MRSQHAFENLLREPVELYSGLVMFCGAYLVIHWPSYWLLTSTMSWLLGLALIGLGLVRFLQGMRVLRYQRGLLRQPAFSLSTVEVPISVSHLYVGKGFRWQAGHRQRLHLLSLTHNQHYVQRNGLYRFVQARAKEVPNGLCAKLTQLSCLPFKPMADIGGKPWLHGVGADKEREVYINQSNRNGHECVFGMTRVGKTRYLSIRVNQDIRNGDAVLVIDPKGDLEVMQDIYCAASVAGRLDDLMITHFGFPELSAKYNPLASFSHVGEVASRITGAIAASGEGQAFKDFAWQYLNIVSRCLHELKESINYKTIAFYVKQPEVLLVRYVDTFFPDLEPGYLSEVQAILDENDSCTDKEGNPLPAMKRSEAIKHYLTRYIEMQVAAGVLTHLIDGIIVPLYNAAMLDETYYDKITASIGPVLDKINQTQAHEIFSWDNSFGLRVIRLEDVIKRKGIVYIGLDSLTNKDMAEAVGQAIISDLVSLCGRLYNEARESELSLCLHCDEFSNIVRDEFVNLLNKAGGAGIKVSAYTQTVNDLGAVFGGNSDKPKMLLGNFGTITMLRVSNDDTAELFTRCLERVRARSATPSTMANDKSEGNGGELFTTYNTDTVNEIDSALISTNDLYALPKGQAFVMTNGGELYKVRLPLPKNDGTAPKSFEAILSEVNLCFV